MNKCAAGTPLHGNEPCSVCRAKPGDVCHRHYAAISEENETLKRGARHVCESIRHQLKNQKYTAYIEVPDWLVRQWLNHLEGERASVKGNSSDGI